MKVGVLGAGLIGWGGGIDLLKNYIDALKSIKKIDAILFLPIIPNVENIKNDFLKAQPNLKIELYQNNSYNLIGALDQHKIDIVFPSHSPQDNSFPFAWVGYICDFQHKYYPNFFTDQECKSRDHLFYLQTANSDAIITTSQDVKNDILKYYPNDCNPNKIYAAPFCPVPKEEYFYLDHINIEKYNLPEKYFIICNQFWVHKAHDTAFKALSELYKSGNYQNIHLICTGLANDYRDKDHFNKLKNLIHDLNIDNKVHFLGYIPKLDQIKILRNAIAVIQPTLFEGGRGGGISTEAISLGKRVILSDIAVNKEIQSPFATFFKTGDVDDLKNKMIEILTTDEIKMSDDKLIKIGYKNQNKLGIFFYNMFKEILNNKSVKQRLLQAQEQRINNKPKLLFIGLNQDLINRIVGGAFNNYELLAVLVGESNLKGQVIPYQNKLLFIASITEFNKFIYDFIVITTPNLDESNNIVKQLIEKFQVDLQKIKIYDNGKLLTLNVVKNK